MPHVPLPKMRCVYNGRSMVMRKQTGGKISVQQDPAMAPLPAAAKKQADTDPDKKALKAKLMMEVAKNL
jgi:hypothetical protein